MNFDEFIFLLCNGYHTQFLDVLMRALSNPYTWIPFYMALFGALVYKFGWVKAVLMLAVIGAAVGLSDWFCASVIRPAVQRLRPGHPENPFSEFVTLVNGNHGSRYGFPSCHAANHFALVGAISMFVNSHKFALFMVVWALLVCYTRMYLGLHYPSDLLVGGLIGGGIGVSFAATGRYYFDKIRHYRESSGYKVYCLNIPLAGGYSLALPPIVLPLAVLVLTLLYGALLY